MKKKTILKWRIVLCTLLSLGYYANSFAIDYYWIGKGTANNWSLPGNWATTSGASASDVLYPPTKNDDVIFDENSFPTGGDITSRTVTINTGATCDNLTFRDIPTDIIPILNITSTLAVGGSATLWSGMTVSGSNGTIRFESNRVDETFTTSGVACGNTNFLFAGNSNYVVNGNLTARDITLSGNGNRQFSVNVDCGNFYKTGIGNLDISGYLDVNVTSTDAFAAPAFGFFFSDGGNMTVGSNVTVRGNNEAFFLFSGDGNLLINGNLSARFYHSSAGGLDRNYRSVHILGSGIKTIKGNLYAYDNIYANGGTVNIEGDINVTTYGSDSEYQGLIMYPTHIGGNPNILGGCKMTITGNITGPGRLSISGTDTEVEVKGSYSTFRSLYIVNGGKLVAKGTVECEKDWYSSGGVAFTAATAPSLVKIKTGSFYANAADVYNDVEFFGNSTQMNDYSASNINDRYYHQINRGTYSKITFLGGSGRISTDAGITTNQLIIKPETEFIFSNTTTVNNRLEIKPDRCGGMIQVTGGTIAMGAGSTVVAENLLLTNSTITGGPFTATNSVDNGGNTGWIFSNTPKTLYWIGGAGNWNDIAHWANSSGGAAGSCLPTLLDNVVFDGASGLTGSEFVTIPGGYFAYCNNMTWSGITGTPHLYITDVANTRLYIGGSLELNPGMTIFGATMAAREQNKNGIYFVSIRNAPYETIKTNGVAMQGNIRFISGAPATTGSGGWGFLDDWTGNANVFFERGDLNTHGKAFTAKYFKSITGARTLNIAGSTVTMRTSWDYYGTGSNILTDVHTNNSLIMITEAASLGENDDYGFRAKTGDKYNNLDFITAQSSLTLNYALTRWVYNGIFNKIILSDTYTKSSSGPILQGTIVTDSLVLAGEQGATFVIGNFLTVNKYFESPQDCGLQSKLTSGSSTSSYTITMGNAGVSGENVNMKNMEITRVNITGGPMPAEGYPAVDCDLGTGQETGWNIYSSAGNKRYYWIGGTGDWNDRSHWSDESGGAGNVFCNPPSPANTVVFDDKSFMADNCVVTIKDRAATCDSMLWVGPISETPKLIFSHGLTVSGSMLLQKNMITEGYSQLSFNSKRSKESLSTNGVLLDTPISFNVAGEWNIPHDLHIGTTTTFDNIYFFNVLFDGTSGAKWVFEGNLSADVVYFVNGTLDLTGTTVNLRSRFSPHYAEKPGRELIIKNATINSGHTWEYNGILTETNSLNSVINLTYAGPLPPFVSTIENTMTTVAGQVYYDVNFGGSYLGKLIAPAGVNTTQFHKVMFDTQATVENGKFEYLYLKKDGTLNTIEADTLRFNNNDEYIYTFISGATSTINEKWYGSGLPCYRLRYQSSVLGEPAYVNVKKEAADYNLIPTGEDVLYLDFIRIKDIVVNQGPGLALIEEGSGSPENEECWDGHTYNLTSWMTLSNGWVKTPYDPILRPMPDATIRCTNFPYVIDPYQFVTTPESTYEWRKGSSTGTILNPGDPNCLTWTINSAEDAGLYYLKVDYHPEGAGKICVIDGVVMISTIANDSLVWTGQIDFDWNKPGNWYDPETRATSTFAPTACTDVLIPKYMFRYPNLTPGNTDYSQLFYETASCHHIWFEHGGEVVRTDSLHYSRAFVELTLAANRWNMITAPLRYMYPGDYYKNVPCPHEDQLRIYQQLFAMSNPQTGVNLEGNWTEPFNNPEIAMPAGFGYAIKLLDNGTLLDGTPVSNETDWVPAIGRHSMWFPKNDTKYNIYVIRSSDGQGNPPFTASCNDIDNTLTINRGSGSDNHRFIYESGNTWKTTGDVTLTTAGATGTGKQVIVGNPFMAHWDLSNFVAQNPGKFKEEYKVLESGNDAAFVTYSPLTSTNKLVAPMQSVLITSTATFGATELTTNVKSMVQSPGNILKSAAGDELNLLKIVAEKDDKINWTHILFDAMADNNYDLNEDSYKLFVTKVTEPVAVYTRSQDGIALDINVFGNTGEMIPLGVRTATTGTINLQFEGANNFYKLYLIDAQYGIKIDLKETPEYNFDKTTSDLFMDGRLFLSIENAPNSDFFPAQGAASVFTSNNQLQVISDSNIDEVQVFDMQGRLLHQAHNIDTSTYTCSLSNSGMYVVKVLTGKSVTIKKITIDK